MDKETHKAIKDCIVHYIRMRKWVKNQKGKVNRLTMYKKLGEAWMSKDCAICRMYMDKDGYVSCNNCILTKTYYRCLHPNSVWFMLQHSETWSEWYKHSTVMLRQLKTLLKE